MPASTRRSSGRTSRRRPRAPGVVAEKEGDAPARLKDGALFEATYELPFLAHAPMEMTNCTVHVHDGACEVWVGTQVPGFAQAGAAKVLGIDPAKVTINNHLIGGGFGRRLEADGVVTAVRIAAHVDGPVKVVWSREEDIRQELYRPLYHDRLKARVENGRITAWQSSRHRRLDHGALAAAGLQERHRHRCGRWGRGDSLCGRRQADRIHPPRERHSPRLLARRRPEQQHLLHRILHGPDCAQDRRRSRSRSGAACWTRAPAPLAC